MSKYFKSTVIDGAKCYSEITKDEAKSILKYCPEIEVVKIDSNDNMSKVTLESLEEENKAKNQFNSFLSSVNDAINKASKKINDTVNSWFKDDSTDPKSKTSKILKMVSYMDKDDIHGLVDEIIEDDDVFNSLDLAALMPFLTDSDCDRVFMKSLISENKTKPSDMAKFVSMDALSFLVDQYIEGKYQDLDVDEIYPYLDSKDLKRLLMQVLKNDCKKQEESKE